MIVGMTIIDMRDHGAIADGSRVTTRALQAAIDAVRQAGGGTVRLAPGRYVSGTLTLCSHLCFELEPGAVLHGSGDLAEIRCGAPTPTASISMAYAISS